MSPQSDNPLACPRPASELRERNGGIDDTVAGSLAAFAIVALLFALLIPAERGTREASRSSYCTNHLKQFGLALHNYELAYGALPPAYTVDANGKPLHSWRTLILPYVEATTVYDSIDLAKPWNDPANAEAYNHIIPNYQCPEARQTTNETTYLAVVTRDGCFRPQEPRPLSDIKDTFSETILILEVPAARSVHWMSPLDADEQVISSFGSDAKLPHDGELHALFADGSVRPLSGDLATEVLRALTSIAGREKVEDF